MAVEAVRDCLSGEDVAGVDTLMLASTTLPFLERHNTGVVRAALVLPEHMMTLDITASQRAGTSVLIAALQARRGRAGGSVVVAAEQRRTNTASTQELSYGDAAAALVVAETDAPIAAFLGAHQVAVDFVDRYRGQLESFDYQWEEHWVRDEGHLKILPPGLRGLCAAAGIDAANIDRLLIPIGRGAALAVAKAIGARPESVSDDLAEVMGDSGVAHPLVMLAHELERARPAAVLRHGGVQRRRAHDGRLHRRRTRGPRHRRAYAEAGIRNPAREIAMLECHDCFSIAELVTLEDLGLSEDGAAWRDVLDGRYNAEGALPCQIDGGLKCFGHPIGASGLRMLYEMYNQLLGRAGERQLPSPRIGLTHNLGGFPYQNVSSVCVVGMLA